MDPDGTGAPDDGGPATTPMDGDGTSGTEDSAVWINPQGRVVAGTNPFGIAGDWYAFGDGTTSTESGNPYRDGMYCVTGQAPGDGDATNHWGAGIGLDLLGMNGQKMPYAYAGVITGFRMRLVGTAPSQVRVQFVTNLDGGVSPFLGATMGESVVYSIADSRVPLEWAVPNAGEQPTGTLYSLQILAPGSDAVGPIDLCVAEFEPIFEPVGTGAPVDSQPYINPDGWIRAAMNPFAIEGQVYAISDGVSSNQSGNPFREGKYCVAGEFLGAEGNWGAGIAFNLNHVPGGMRLPYDPTARLGGFRIGMSGTTPGNVQLNFVTSDPPDGNQPLLVGRLNTSTIYRTEWAQVPASWDVPNAGATVGTSVYTLQIVLDGATPGPFNLCIEEFVPLAENELTVSALPAAPGYTGARTIDAGILTAEYNTWKQRHFRDCNDGTACIPRDEGDCISEGIGYGMLLAVGNDDQDAFDKLWAYYERHKNPRGVMNWQTNACGNVIGQGSATDGELDAAMALIQANCKWGGNYRNEAVELITAIRTTEVTFCNNQTVLMPGDGFGGCNRTNPSYFAPGYYKVFQTVTGDTTWGNLANDSYTLLASNQGRLNGLVSNWTDSTGIVPAGTDGEYGPDASRTPWRVAVDYAWFGDTRAVTFLNNVSTYVDANGGVERLFTPNSNFRGGLAMSGLQQDPTTAQAYVDAWLTTAVDDGTYFPGTLRPIYMMLMAHAFPNGC